MESWQISTILSFSNPIIVLALTATAALVVWTFASIDPHNGWRIRLGFSALRLFICFCAIYILMQPNLIVTRTANTASPVAVVFDGSASMGFPFEENRLSVAVSRATEALGNVQKVNNIDVQFFSFAEFIGPVENINHVSLRERETGATNFGTMVSYIARLNEDRDFAGVLLFTDGADTSNVSMSDIKTTGLPFNVAFVGSDSKRKDLLVKDVNVDGFAFSRKQNPIQVVVENHGLPLTQTKVNLRQDGALLQQKTVTVIDGQGQLTFNVVPRYPGRLIYEIEVPAHPDEDITENNSRFVELNVMRDKYRILHLSGAPSWDQRFLRDMMTSWPQVDLVSFYLLRTTYQSTTQSNAGLSLIPFPTQKLFTEHLREFDLVVFQDFSPETVGVDVYLDGIADYVEDGGALIVMGGVNGLTSASIAKSRLGKLLPMVLPSANTPPSKLINDAPFSPVLTEVGKRHPLFMRPIGDDLPEEQLRSLPRLNGVVHMKRVQGNGQVLLAHSHIRNEERGIPLMAVSEPGKGRTLMIATDSLWSWGFSAAMTGAPSGFYSDFWKQTIRWLTRSRELARLKLDIERENDSRRTPVNLNVSVLNSDYLPAAGEKLTINIFWTDENEQSQSDSLEGLTNSAGMFRHIWQPRHSGPHTVRVKVTSTEMILTDSFLVAPENQEVNHLSPSATRLREMSEISGGEFFDGKVNIDELRLKPVQGNSVLSRKDTALWSHPLTFLFLFSLIFAEWMLRRYRGLI